MILPLINSFSFNNNNIEKEKSKIEKKKVIIMKKILKNLKI